MGFFGLVSEKKLKEAQAEIENLKLQLSPEQLEINSLQERIAALNAQINHEEEKLSQNQSEIEILKSQIQEKKKDLIELDDEILYQSYSLYQPKYDFATSEGYKDRLDLIRDKQKQMIKNKTAVDYFNGWTVDGSKAKGQKMTNDNIKMILRCFNTDCENAIDRVKIHNIDSMRARIEKSFETLNKLNETNRISIKRTYLDLKLEELCLAVEYAYKKQEEKEEQKRLRAELREQAKLEKEIEEARKNIAKEQKHYNNALDKLNSQLAHASDEQKDALLQKKAEIEEQLQTLQKSLEDVDYRAANQKAGYVYVISNIGAFGENVYKIGMTRRLEPMDRVDELGDASVPFNFDVHAMIFSEDAPKLEAALHKAFEDSKVNMVNTRREFFHVTLDEIEAVVKANYDKTVDFIRTPPAEQYRQSVAMKEAAITKE